MRNLVVTSNKDVLSYEGFYRLVKKRKDLLNVCFLLEDGQELSKDEWLLIHQNESIISVVLTEKNKGTPVPKGFNTLVVQELSITENQIEMKEDIFKSVQTGRNRFCIRIPSEYNRLDKLLDYKNSFKDKQISFLGGTLLKINGLDLGYLSTEFLSSNNTKYSKTLLGKDHYALLTKEDELLSLTKEQYLSEVSQERKPKSTGKKGSKTSKVRKEPKKSSTTSSPKQSQSKSKPAKPKSLRDLFKQKR